MNLSDFLNTLKDTLTAKWEEFQESPVYAQIKERYDSLSPVGQKSVIGSVIGTIVLIIYMIPHAFISSADDAIDVFEEKKLQAQELLEVNQASKSLPPLPPRLDAIQLKNALNSRLQEAGLAPEQIKGVNERTEAPSGGGLVPNSVIQNVVDVEIGQLNLKQMVDIEFQFSKISPLVKVVSLDMMAHPSDNHYYDVRYTVASFTVQETEKDVTPATAPRGAVKSRPSTTRGSRPSKSNSESVDE